MLNEDASQARKRQINQHKVKPKKVFQYSLRLDQRHYQMLHDLAVKTTMSKVIDRAIEVQHNYQIKTANFVDIVSKLKTKSEIDRWVVDTFQSDPEMLSTIAKTGAIMEHSKVIKDVEKVRQNYLNDLDTIGYLINKFGVNLNQLAKKANQGNIVPKDEMNMLVIELKNLNQLAENIRKGVC